MSEIHGVDLTTEGVVTVKCDDGTHQGLSRGWALVHAQELSPHEGRRVPSSRSSLLEEATEVNVLFGNASNLAQQDTEFSFERKLQLVQELRDMLTLAGKTVKMSIC